MINKKEEYKIEELSLKDLFERYNLNDFSSPGMLSIEDENIEIESYDEKTKQSCWSKITDLVVKEKSEVHYQLGTLKGTAQHKLLFNNEWVELKNHPDAIKVNKEIEVLDLSVKDTNCYLAEGQINHNTTTPGGMAIPFAASVRLRVYTPQKIKEMVDKQEVIRGIQIRIGTVKNKVARPYRQAELQIIYGKGITDLELLFDDLRVFCESDKFISNKQKYALEDGIVGQLTGSGAWKTFELINLKTGEIVEEKKFYKVAFPEIFSNEKYKPYILSLCDGAFILKMNEKDELSAVSGPVSEHGVD